MMYRIEKYNTTYYSLWNDFVSRSKNGTFLFHRDFMEYHRDRFTDYSLLIFENNKLVAIFPANSKNDILYSHQGLTYGGLIYTEKLKQAAVIQVMETLLGFLRSKGVIRLFIKQIPFIYHKYPAQEVEYALFLADAKITRRDSLSVIDNFMPLKIASNRMEGVKKGIANSLIIKESDDFSPFWNTILIPNLVNKYGVNPVHSLEEINLLKKRFPQNIKHYVVLHNGIVVAGTVLFETDTVIHAQYISSAADNKNELGSLDFLYHYLITDVYKDKRYFDFGISNEEQGRKLNEGLIYWKETFGARTVVQDFYELEIV